MVFFVLPTFQFKIVVSNIVLVVSSAFEVSFYVTNQASSYLVHSKPIYTILNSGAAHHQLSGICLNGTLCFPFTLGLSCSPSQYNPTLSSFQVRLALLFGPSKYPACLSPETFESFLQSGTSHLTSDAIGSCFHLRILQFPLPRLFPMLKKLETHSQNCPSSLSTFCIFTEVFFFL